MPCPCKKGASPRIFELAASDDLRLEVETEIPVLARKHKALLIPNRNIVIVPILRHQSALKPRSTVLKVFSPVRFGSLYCRGMCTLTSFLSRLQVR
jgi:hypothetical protein